MTKTASLLLAQFAEDIIKEKITQAVKELERLNHYNQIQRMREKARIDDNIIVEILGLKSNENNKNPDACQSTSGE